jgi:cell division septal protein FtsQ
MKKKKKKRKFKKIVIVFFFIFVLSITLFLLSLIKVRGYYVLDNKYLDEDTILDNCGLNEESSFLLTQTFIVNKKCNNSMIKKVNVDHTLTLEIRLHVEEYKVLYKYENYAINELGKKVDYPSEDAPVLVNKIKDEKISENFIKKMNKVDDEILSIVSEIKYDPNDVDNERFLFYMNDGNMVYVTLSKITKINSYPSITKTIENRRGVLYLDYGNYFVPIE